MIGWIDSLVVISGGNKLTDNDKNMLIQRVILLNR